jgi:hypothetical protein
MSVELGLLSRIRTLADPVAVFSDDDRCRRLLEVMVWPRGRLCAPNRSLKPIGSVLDSRHKHQPPIRWSGVEYQH